MTIELLTNKKGNKISKYIYGQFSEHLGRGIYEGLYVGENSNIPNVNGMRTDVVEALKQIHVPVLRWPGGLFADTYHWKDGVGPKEGRKKIVNTNWGDVTEDNSFGTHEYFELLKQLGADSYVAANMGSGTIQEMAEWVEYMTMDGESPMANWRRQNGQNDPWKLKFFGIGNESWGGGGNMRPEYYSDLYRQYQAFVPQYNKDEPIVKVACGPNEDDYEWTDKIMQNAGEFLDAISLHYYDLPTNTWGTGNKGDATGFPESEWDSTMVNAKKMDELVTKHSTIMDKYDPEKRVSLFVDEWGMWTNSEPGTNPGFLYQQNTIRDAMVAAITLNIFHKHSDRVRMANIAQTVNVLQAMILTDGEKMIKTPTYYVFDMYQRHMDAQLVEGFGEEIENVSYTASTKDGELTISVVKYDKDKEQDIEFDLDNKYSDITYSKVVTADKIDAHNTFDNPDVVSEQDYDGAKLSDSKVSLKVAPKSVITITLK
ncbi:alpha-L-arabinofuranosidase C-terminal domain-containing protein [Lentilactobacillus sp. Marseille-Q4993]|uniref:alpha-N-arabinofuranosidase n=1 Tax=Lentilactobacillus sp. Marseille-Q4993 TaxID=3039492 RepID=UPI0024BC4851|nr:alpha-L-arabinofuranosidase C-terminal domain-containing protein [Lentilactobacillus sp. Marseille-Q4993]